MWKCNSLFFLLSNFLQMTETSFLPTSFNWASEDNIFGESIVSPIRNQGMCGACYAFAASEAVAASLRINSDNRIHLNLSVQELLDCDTIINKGCNGGDPSISLRYVYNHGLSEWTDYNYVAKDYQTCRADFTSSTTRVFIKGVIGITSLRNILIKRFLISLGPIVTGICGTDESFLFYKNGIFDNSKCCSLQNHAVLIVGYGFDDIRNESFWILKNSWGTSWGEEGYMRIKMVEDGSPSICGFDKNPIIPFGAFVTNFHTNDNTSNQSKSWTKSKSFIWVQEYWKGLLALFSTLLLVVSLCMLLYTVSVDYRFKQKYLNQLNTN